MRSILVQLALCCLEYSLVYLLAFSAVAVCLGLPICRRIFGGLPPSSLPQKALAAAMLILWISATVAGLSLPVLAAGSRQRDLVLVFNDQPPYEATLLPAGSIAFHRFGYTTERDDRTSFTIERASGDKLQTLEVSWLTLPADAVPGKRYRTLEPSAAKIATIVALVSTPTETEADERAAEKAIEKRLKEKGAFGDLSFEWTTAPERWK